MISTVITFELNEHVTVVPLEFSQDIVEVFIYEGKVTFKYELVYNGEVWVREIVNLVV